MYLLISNVAGNYNNMYLLSIKFISLVLNVAH